MIPAEQRGNGRFESKVDVVESKRFWVIDPKGPFQIDDKIHCERVVDDDARYRASIQVLSRAGGALALSMPADWERVQARAHVRIAADDLQVRGQCRVGEARDCKFSCINISAGGFMLEVDALLEMNDEYVFDFCLPETDNHFKIAGRVVRVDEPGPASDAKCVVGIQFTDIGEEDSGTITRWVYVEQIRQRHTGENISHDE